MDHNSIEFCNIFFIIFNRIILEIFVTDHLSMCECNTENKILFLESYLSCFLLLIKAPSSTVFKILHFYT